VTIELKLPDAGMGITDATIVRWLKNEGDPVTEGEVVAEMETAKSIVEVYATATGVLERILVPEDADAVVDQTIAEIRETS
jgi:pyruvate/2-oxoglutarate dehydrogenase complex dihydrolipoamide acyltransferase (E2) component